jgi:putative isomerase
MKNLAILLLLLVMFSVTSSAQQVAEGSAEYEQIQNRLAKGWNTWNTRSVTSHVLLPDGLAINLAFKQHKWLDEKYLAEPLIGRSGDGAENVRPGYHAYDGSYTELQIRWRSLDAKIQTAHAGDDLVILITPKAETSALPLRLVIESGILWNRSGYIQKDGDHLTANFAGKEISIFTTAALAEDDPYIEPMSPYLPVILKDKQIGISTGKRRTVEQIAAIIALQKQALAKEASAYGELAEAYLAVQAGVAWNLIYEPKHRRAVATVGRLWNAEYGGYCLFGWDNFFLAYVTSLASRDLAYANIIEHLRGATEEGFLPNDNRGNGSKSFDRSQPPVGAIMVREIYKRYPERWFLEAAYQPLLKWNRWWFAKRMNDGLLAYGSHRTKNPFQEPSVMTMRTARYESGMDDSPMYEDIVYNKETETMALHDVGLNSLVLADCKALIEMATILGKDDDILELQKSAAQLEQGLESLWDEDYGMYLNRDTSTGELSKRLSPTLFYPLLAGLPDSSRAGRIINEHFYNPDEFFGEWMLPSTARNDKSYERQRYWKGAIWPPLNFLTYLSLRQSSMNDAATILSDKSLQLLLGEWQRKGYVSENYSSITGAGDEKNLSSDNFHSWGTLFGIIAFIEGGYLPAPEAKIIEWIN